MFKSKDIEWLNRASVRPKDKIYAYRRLSSNLRTYKLKVIGWKKLLHANGNEKKA